MLHKVDPREKKDKDIFLNCEVDAKVAYVSSV